MAGFVDAITAAAFLERLGAPLVAMTLFLSALEYVLIAVVFHRSVNGGRLRAFARRRGWSLQRVRGDEGRRPPGSAGSQGRRRPRRARQVVRGSTPLCTFSLYLYRGGRRRRGDQPTAAVCVMPAPFRAPDIVIRTRPDGEAPRADDDAAPFHERFDVGSLDADFAFAVLSPEIQALASRHPDLSWQWRRGNLIVSSHARPSLAGLQELVRATEHFRALLPLAPPVRTSGRGGLPGVAAPSAV